MVISKYLCSSKGELKVSLYPRISLKKSSMSGFKIKIAVYLEEKHIALLLHATPISAEEMPMFQESNRILEERQLPLDRHVGQ
jgi:hypothetical protein